MDHKFGLISNLLFGGMPALSSLTPSISSTKLIFVINCFSSSSFSLYGRVSVTMVMYCTCTHSLSCSVFSPLFSADCILSLMAFSFSDVFFPSIRDALYKTLIGILTTTYVRLSPQSICIDCLCVPPASNLFQLVQRSSKHTHTYYAQPLTMSSM